MKNPIIAVVVIIILALGIWYGFMKDPAVEEESPLAEVNMPIETGATTTDNAPETEAVKEEVKINKEIVYSANGFSPAVLTVKKGETVTFVNNSGRNFRPASDNHPTHTLYPEFDSGKPIASGEEYSFTFEKVGDWGYHDHARATSVGIVRVTE